MAHKGKQALLIFGAVLTIGGVIFNVRYKAYKTVQESLEPICGIVSNEYITHKGEYGFQMTTDSGKKIDVISRGDNSSALERKIKSGSKVCFPKGNIDSHTIFPGNKLNETEFDEDTEVGYKLVKRISVYN